MQVDAARTTRRTLDGRTRDGRTRSGTDAYTHRRDAAWRYTHGRTRYACGPASRALPRHRRGPDCHDFVHTSHISSYTAPVPESVDVAVGLLALLRRLSLLHARVFEVTLLHKLQRVSCRYGRPILVLLEVRLVENLVVLRSRMPSDIS